MLYRNLKPDAAFDYIAHLDFDVLCLQEVPDHFLPRLEALPFRMVFGTDVSVIRAGNNINLHHVILSRYPIVASHAFLLPSLHLPRRVYTLVQIKEGVIGNLGKREGLYADIDFGTGPVRVFSLHLTLSSPTDRRREFGVVEQFLPKGFPAIVTGDLNIIEHPVIKLGNWLCGSSLAEAMPWHDERSEVEATFKRWGMKNPLRGKVTLGISGSQLDHILIPQDVEVTKAEVFKDRHGSDHRPISVEVRMEKAVLGYD